MEITLNWKTGIIILLILLTVITILYLNLFAQKVDEHKAKIYEVIGTILDIKDSSLLVEPDEQYAPNFDKVFYVNTNNININFSNGERILVKYHNSSGYPITVEALEIEKIN